MTSKYVSKAGLCFKLVSLLTYELLVNTTLILVEITEQILLLSLLVQSEKMTKKKAKFGALPMLKMPKKSTIQGNLCRDQLLMEMQGKKYAYTE